MLARDIVHGSDEIGPLDIVIHSLSSADASRVLREVIVKDFIEPLAGKLEQPTASPAALIAAFSPASASCAPCSAWRRCSRSRVGRLESLMSAAIDGIIKAEAAVEPAP